VRTAVVLLTRDLRVHDNPALWHAVTNADRVVPLFVLDPRLLRISPNRHRFLLQALADLRASLRRRGGDLVIRRGEPAGQASAMVRRVRADQLVVAADVSRYARRRERRLADACERLGVELSVVAGSSIVEPGLLRPYRVFTPYYRAWLAVAGRSVVAAPRSIRLPSDVDSGEPPAGPVRGLSPAAIAGGESLARARLDAWLPRASSYVDLHNALAGDATSRLSPYLRFGCVSTVEFAERLRSIGGSGAEAVLRQLCWRDFYYQVAAAHPGLTTRPIRAGAADQWADDPTALGEWQQGRTGAPLVDAGMRQLLAEGWMHNRARLVVGDYLTKHLGVDWRLGAAWFERWLLDGDVPNNYGNWQWVAGVGNDARPYRRFSPQRQAERYDPSGDYVRRYAE
jgi:deoxyribodipyrimidine photo-lyase